MWRSSFLNINRGGSFRGERDAGPPIVAVAAAIPNAVPDATGADSISLRVDPEKLLVATNKRQEG